MEAKTATSFLIVLGLWASFVGAESPAEDLQLLKEKLNFAPTTWYFRSKGPKDDCYSVPDEGPSRSNGDFYNCSVETLGEVKCFCVMDTMEYQLPEKFAGRYTNMCVRCGIGMAPLPQHLDAFESSIAKMASYKYLLSMSQLEWNDLFGKYRYIMMPPDMKKECDTTRDVVFGMKEMANNADDPAEATQLLNRIMLKKLRTYPIPGIEFLIEEDGDLNPVLQGIANFGGLLMGAMKRLVIGQEGS